MRRNNVLAILADVFSVPFEFMNSQHWNCLCARLKIRIYRKMLKIVRFLIAQWTFSKKKKYDSQWNE